MNADELVEKIEALLSKAGGEWKYFYKPKYDEHHVSVRGDGNGLALAMFTDGCPFGEQFARYLEAVQPQNIALLLSDLASSAARIAEMEKALKPFADVAYRLREVDLDYEQICNEDGPIRPEVSTLTVGDLREARRASLGGRSDG